MRIHQASEVHLLPNAVQRWFRGLARCRERVRLRGGDWVRTAAVSPRPRFLC